ncbi:hypothetical protein [Solibacillus sp. FSL W8-0474]|uniref:hypothetical protein n=1 Tax=Solibacillus sp. FSL W8-0474 TaxID=2975336 RepID=UPI004046CFAE
MEPIYKVNSSRPSKFEVEYKINSKKYEVNLSNYNRGVKFRDKTDGNWTKRDNENLIKGEVPIKYIKVTSKE